MHQAPSSPSPAGPEFFLQMHFAAVPPRLVTTALQLGVPEALGRGAASAEKVAKETKCSPRAMRILLDGLVAIQVCRKSRENYELTPLAAQYLVKDSPDYAGAMLESDALLRVWDSLAEVVRSGKPTARVENKAEAEKFFPSLIRSLHILNREPARRAAVFLAPGMKGESPRVLDVACGSGVWGIAIAEAVPKARVTAHDYPAILELTNDFARRHKVADRFEYLAGDLKQVDFGQSRFDVAVLGNIVHSEGEKSSRDLLRRVGAALKPGGRIVIVDMIPNDERTGPPFPLLFAVNMLINTESGDTYSAKQYSEWLKAAGFGKVETPDIASHSPLLVATRV